MKQKEYKVRMIQQHFLIIITHGESQETDPPKMSTKIYVE